MLYSFVLLAMMRSVLVIFLVFCVVFFCLACYDEVRVGHLSLVKKMTNTDLCVVFFCHHACYDEVRVGHLFSFLCCILLSCLL